MRHQGKPVKRWWFVIRWKQILDELESDHIFFFRIIGLRGSRTNITYHREENFTVLEIHPQL